MRQLLLGAVLGIAAAALIAGLAAYAGVVEVGADAPHAAATLKLISLVRERSIARSARDIEVPADLAAPGRLREGAGNYEAMCADCHLRPGDKDSEIRAGLYPQPPDLAHSDQAGEPGESARRFWTIKHGIKASGMPAWSKGGLTDEDIWNLVAFVNKLPELSADQYRLAVAASRGHTHGGHAADEDHDHADAGGHAGSDHDHGDGHEHGDDSEHHHR